MIIKPWPPGWKDAIIDAAETDTVFLESAGPCLRALRTETTEALARGEGEAMSTLAGGKDAVYFGGRLEEGVALTGQVAGRIDAVLPVAEIIGKTVQEFENTIDDLASLKSGV